MSNLDRVVSVGKELQKSQQVLTDFKEKRITQIQMEEKLGNVLVKVRRALL